MRQTRAIIPALSAEEELILCCARVELAGARRRFHELLAKPIDWKRIAEIAHLHRLRPLLFKHFSAEGKSGLMPASEWTLMQKHAGFIAARNLALTSELVKLLKLFRDIGLEAIPFKGPVLALQTYRNLALREFHDMDLLLRREEILGAKRALLDLGYTSPWKQNGQWEQQHIDTQLGCDFVSASGKVRLELHWSFIQKWLTYNVDLESIWRRAETWQLAGFPVLTIAKEDLLLCLCAHGAKHHWERLFWIIDIAEMIRAETNLDWSAMLDRAKAQGSSRLLALGLFLAQSLLDVPLPETISKKIQEDPAVASLARQVGTWLFHEEQRVESGDWSETKFYLGVKERWGDRAAYSTHLLKLTLTPSDADRAFVKLPTALSFLYPAVRPIRWLSKKRRP